MSSLEYFAYNAFFVALFTVAFAATASATSPTPAGKPGMHGGAAPPGLSKHVGHPGYADYQRGEYHGLRTADDLSDTFFNERRIAIIRDYYRGMFSGGHCPPSLAKNTMVGVW